MTQYNTLNVKLSNLQLNKLKSGMKKGNEVNLLSNVIGDSNDETNFRNKFLLTDRQVLRLCKAFENNLSVNKNLSKTQLSKMVQLGGILGRFLGPLLKTGFPLTKKMFFNH